MCVCDVIVQAAVDAIEDIVQWSRVKMDGNVAMKIGSQKQVSTVHDIVHRQNESLERSGSSRQIPKSVTVPA